MDVRCAAGVGHRPDRHEAIAANPVGRRLPVSLEVLVERRTAIVVADVMVAAVGVALPDFDPGAGNWPPVQVENAPADIGSGALRRPITPGNVDQVVV